MNRIYSSRQRGIRAPFFCATFGVFLLVLIPLSAAAQLTLQQAEDRALSMDPVLRGAAAEQVSLEELAVAAAQLPDPMIRMGLVSLPVDSFDLGQEAMTQIVAGVVLKFPRGDSRSLERRQLLEKASAVDLAGRDTRLQIQQDVRLLYLDLQLQLRQINLTEEVIGVFASLVEISRDYYASGLAQQQDVLQAEVELGRMRDRAARFSQEERLIRARLGVYLGDEAFSPLPEEWPALPALQEISGIREELQQHPRIRSLQQQIAVADTGVDLARQKYRPEFALDASYGFRSGEDSSGVARPDLFSVMVFMDVPLFHGQRQDRVTAASLASAEAVTFARDDAYRRLLAELNGLSSLLEDIGQRVELYEDVLLPQAQFSADASFEAYQSSVGDLTDLLRARIAEYELGLEFSRLQAEVLKTRVRLLYLQGGAA